MITILHDLILLQLNLQEIRNHSTNHKLYIHDKQICFQNLSNMNTKCRKRFFKTENIPTIPVGL